MNRYIYKIKRDGVRKQFRTLQCNATIGIVVTHSPDIDFCIDFYTKSEWGWKFFCVCD